MISFTVIHGNVECYLAAAVHSFLSGFVESGFEFLSLFFLFDFYFFQFRSDCFKFSDPISSLL